jgi:hypothetical protein
MIPRSSRPFQSLRAGSARGVSRTVLSALTFGAPLLLLAQSLTSCGSDDDGGGACEPNQVVACAGPGNCPGDQTCAADGSGFSACTCDGVGAGGSAGGGAGGTANAGAAGAAGSGPSPDDPLFPANAGAVGAPCATDADCPVGPGGETPLTCITPNSTVFAGGGPEGGYCTLPCTDSDQCATVDGPSVCGLQDEAGNGGYCFRLCQPGPQGVKCPSAGSACVPGPAEVGNIGLCTPVCGSDFACGDGLFCNLAPEGMAVCQATERTGGETGAGCTPATADTDCKSGFCIAPDGNPENAFCTTFCTLGLSDACGYNEATGLPREAVCALAPTASADVLDLGLCIELCDLAEDCEQDDWICEDLPADIQGDFGRQGRCVPPGGADAGVTDAG